MKIIRKIKKAAYFDIPPEVCTDLNKLVRFVIREIGSKKQALYFFVAAGLSKDDMVQIGYSKKQMEAL